MTSHPGGGSGSAANVDSALASLLASVAEFSDAEMAAVAVFVGDGQLVVRAVTPGLEPYLSQAFPLNPGSVSADAVRRGAPVARPGPFGWQEEGPVGYLAAQIVAVPLTGRRSTAGILYVGRRTGEEPFTEAEVAIAARFAHHAALVLELLRERDEREVLDLLEDRHMRISTFGDEALQQLFALDLQIDRMAARLPDEVGSELQELRTRLTSVSGALRRMMVDQSWPSHDCGSLRQRVSLAVEFASHTLQTDVHLVATGDLDGVPGGALADDAIASLRALLGVLCPGVSDVAVDVACLAGADGGAGALSLTVSCTLPPGVGDSRAGGHAIADARRRARRHGGHVDITESVDGGWARMLWTIPLGARQHG